MGTGKRVVREKLDRKGFREVKDSIWTRAPGAWPR